MKADTPITLAGLQELTHEEREALIVGIRDRRLKPVKVYEELSLMQAQARKENLEKRWTRELQMFAKELERAERATEKLQARHVKLRSIELELEVI